MQSTNTRCLFAICSTVVLLGMLPLPILADVALAPSIGMMGAGNRALPTLTNVSATAGLGGTAGSFYDWVDFNNDGFMDLIINGHFLYQNSGPPGWTFTDVTAAKGLAGAGGRATFGDYDNDGYIDLYNADWNDQLYHNNGPPNFDFVDVTVAAGNVKDSFPGTGASWGDYDNDGFLDLYVVNGEVWDPYKHYPDTMWKNDGDGTFTNVTISAGVDESKKPYYGRGATWSDFNNDGWQDLYISNYRLQPNYLFVNNGNGTFTEMAKTLNAAGFARDNSGNPGGNMYGHTIGSSWADFNNDGWFDLFVSNLAHKDPDRGKYCDNSNIYINQGFPYWNFTDIRPTSGIPIKPVGGVINQYYNDENWANAAIADFDNDGLLDVYIPQVYNFTWMYSYLYHNEGDLTFTNVSHDLGLDNVVDTYAGAWADYDNDGDMDLVTAGRQNQWGKVEVTNGAATRLYKNDGGTNTWLKVKLIGTISNKDGIGAKLTATVGQKKIVRQVETGMGSHGQQNDIRVNFGLGTATKVDTLEVRWPSGIVQVLKDVTAGQWINVTEDVSGPRISSLTATPSTGYPDTLVNLQAQVTGSPTNYYWDYEGDQIFDILANSNAAQSFTARGTWDYQPTLKVMNSAGTLGFFKATKVLITNMIPMADLGNDRTVVEDEDVEFDAQGTVDTTWDRANLTFQYFFGDQTNTSPIKDEIVHHNYTEAKDYTVTLEVTDPFGAMNSTIIHVKVLNLPPTVEIVGNSSLPEDGVLELKAIGNDTRTDVAKGLKYKWDFGDGKTTGWLSDPAISHPYPKAGQYNVSVTVRDDDLSGNSDNMTLLVYGLNPTAQVNFKTVSVNEDELVIFDGIANDTPTDLMEGLQYRWTFGDGNMSEWSTISSASHVYAKNGTYTAMLIVKDLEGLEGNDTMTVKVQNIAPTAEISDAPTDLKEDQEVEFIGKGTDTPSDQYTLQYRWEFGDGASSQWGLSPTIKHIYNISGDMTVVFQVKDDDGAVISEGTTVKVLNVLPQADIIAPLKTTFDEDILVSFEANGTDTASDQDILNYTWTIEGVSYFGMKVDHIFTKKGSFDVDLKVTDDEKATGLDAVTLKINNIVPSLQLTASKTLVKSGESVTLTTIVSDSPSDRALLKYVWDCGRGSTIEGAGTANATCTFNSPGVNRVKLTVSDDEDGSVTKEVSITIQAKGSGGEDGGLNGMMVAGIAGAVVAAIVVIIIVLMLKKKGDGANRRPKTHAEKDPKTETSMAKKAFRVKKDAGPEEPGAIKGAKEIDYTPTDEEKTDQEEE